MLEELLWAAVEPTVYITREEYFAALADWTVTPHTAEGELVGVVLTRGAEIHFATFGKRWRMTRADLRHYLAPILAAHGRAETKTALDDSRQRRFNKILGFEETGADEFYVHLTLRRSPLLKDTPCQLQP